MSRTTLILDIDGVLITTAPWKQDVLHADGYSNFNTKCVANINKLLSSYSFDIWLSSTRRTHLTLQETNRIFNNRGITQPIFGFLPNCQNCRTRKDEIQSFIISHQIKNYLIIDDDKSMGSFTNQKRVILTELMTGFNENKFNEAIEKLRAIQTNS